MRMLCQHVVMSGTVRSMVMIKVCTIYTGVVQKLHGRMKSQGCMTRTRDGAAPGRDFSQNLQ